MPEREASASAVESYARLLSLAVHELRTPASVVGGYLRMLQRDNEHPLSERQRKMIDEAEKSCARLVALIGEMSEVSKLDAGVAVVKEEPLDLFQLIHDVAEHVHEAEDREVRLDVRGPAGGAPMTGDVSRLRAAFDAFFRAILREQPGKTTVVADLRRDTAGSAVIVVARNTDVQRAYEAPRAVFDEKRGGMGLALPIACRVVARHRGEIWSPAAEAGGSLDGRTAIVVSFPVSEQRS